jgi:hypothetical protein
MVGYRANRRATFSALVGLLATGLWLIPAASAQSIWFDPHSGSRGSADFMDLFQSNAPWEKAAAAISIFEISDEITYKHEVTEGQLAQIFSDLRRRNIGLLVGIGPLTGGEHEGLCGYRVEGYNLAKGLLNEAHHIKSLGGEVRYFGMDEPLFFGHVFDRRGDHFGCRLSIVEIARDVADKLRQVRTVFPAVRFGDVEPLMGWSDDTWLSDLATWFDNYEQATGEKLAFFRLDIGWNRPWQKRIPPLARLLREKGIPLQVIYNGDDRAQSDEAWIASAVAHFQEYESDGRSPPDAAVIQYWQVHPSRVLPESDARTATWLINKYADWRRLRRN